MKKKEENSCLWGEVGEGKERRGKKEGRKNLSFWQISENLRFKHLALIFCEIYQVFLNFKQCNNLF